MPLSLGSPLENCLGAHRAVTPALPNVLQVRGTGGIKTERLAMGMRGAPRMSQHAVEAMWGGMILPISS